MRSQAVPKKTSKAKRKMFKVRQIRSLIGAPNELRECVRGLGLRRIGHVVELEDTPSTRGMVFKVKHLVEVVQGETA